jgi:uncharacterized caspase-like protein
MTVVPWYALREAVEATKGRRILLINTCHSGNAYINQRLENAAYHANIIAYTASRFDQTAKENDNLGHGLFTYAVVEGLEGKSGIAASCASLSRTLIRPSTASAARAGIGCHAARPRLP